MWFKKPKKNPPRSGRSVRVSIRLDEIVIPSSKSLKTRNIKKFESLATFFHAPAEILRISSLL